MKTFIDELEECEVEVSRATRKLYNKLDEHGFNDDKFASRMICIIERNTTVELSY